MNKILILCSFISKEYRDLTGKEMTNLRLQKLLYFVEVISLIEEKELAFEDNIEAWRYGPVVFNTYKRFRDNKSEIESLDTSYLSEYIKNLVNRVVKNTSNIEVFGLVKATQSYDTWIDAWNNLDDKTIYREDIKKYHKNRVEKGLSCF